MPLTGLVASRKLPKTAERGLTYFKAHLNVERARLVAALGRARAAAGDYQTA